MNLNIRLRRFIAQYLSGIVQFMYTIKFNLIKFDKPPVIILTVGKVGSSSIYTTLKKRTNFPVFHVHNLSTKSIAKETQKHLDSDRRSKPLHLIISHLLKKKLKNYKEDIFIVTIVREPISREISSFFQNIEMYKTDVERKNLEVDIEGASKLLQNKLDSDICASLKEWFDVEVKGNFGIDVFKEKFNENKMYSIFNHKKNHLLLLRMEDLDTVFPTAIQEFLKLDSPLKIKNSNIGDKKHYGDVYKTIRDNIKLSPNSINTIINSQYFQQFYEHQKKEVAERWIKRA